MTMQSFSTSENVFEKPNAFEKLSLASLLRRFITMLLQWRQRMESRRELAKLSALDLKDIGYPAGAEAEKAKPFWRA